MVAAGHFRQLDDVIRFVHTGGRAAPPVHEDAEYAAARSHDHTRAKTHTRREAGGDHAGRDVEEEDVKEEEEEDEGEEEEEQQEEADALEKAQLEDRDEAEAEDDAEAGDFDGTDQRSDAEEFGELRCWRCFRCLFSVCCWIGDCSAHFTRGGAQRRRSSFRGTRRSTRM